MTDPAIIGRSGFGVIDHVGRAVCHDGDKASEGWGLFEHGALGRHDLSGFADWLTVAPQVGWRSFRPHAHRHCTSGT